MKDFIHVYGAVPLARSDMGEIYADHDATVRCPDADAACLAAEQMVRTGPYVAGVAFLRTIEFIVGECSRAEILMSFGDPAARERWIGHR